MKERGRTSKMLDISRKRQEIAIPRENSGQNDDFGFGRGRKKVPARSSSIPTKCKVRIRWGRKDLTRFLSHLDNVKVFERALRRSNIPIEFTQGFHPHMKLSFGPPLQLGYSSEAEYLDLTLNRPFQAYMADEISKTLPQGYFIISAMSIIDKKESLSGKLNRAVYEVTVKRGSEIPSMIAELLSKDVVEINRMSKDDIKKVDIRQAIYVLDCKEPGTADPDLAIIYMELGVGSAGYARPSEVLAAAGIVGESDMPGLKFHRKELLYIDDNGNRLTPMEF
jgi:radical SAM-linked protein